MNMILFTRLAIVVSAAGFSFVFAGCGSKHEAQKENSRSLPTARVRVQTVESKTRALTEEVVGTLRAKLRATLEAKVSGRIEAMPVALGDAVQKGQLLARLEAGEIAARLEQAEASMEQAERDWARVSALFEQHSVTRGEYDSARARHRIAKGALAEARAMMSYVEIVAPFPGVVTKKWVDQGDLAAPGKPLLDLEDPGALQLDADVPEAIAAHIQHSSRLKIRVDAVSRELMATVSEIAPAADSGSRTFRVKLDLPPTDGLRSGQFARLTVPIGESQSLRVPKTAVVRRGQLEIAFSVSNQQARLHLVKTGKLVGDEIEVLSGLDPGESVVVDGADKLTDGQPVEAQ